MKLSGQLFIFTIEGQRFGLDLEVVQRVERAAEITKVPETPELISGIIDYHGKIIPVLNLRKKLKLPDKEISASMRFLVVRTESRQLIIIADLVEGVIKIPPRLITKGTEIEKNYTHASFARLENDVIFIYDIDQFLTEEDENVLEKAINGNTNQASPQ